jgi:hypothetical protein
MSGNPVRACGCEGWWEQGFFGRQPMQNLSLAFDGLRIRGSGVDIVGPFTLEGLFDERGGVAMIKQYLGRHALDYLGVYDGEGTMSGEWRLGGFSGAWMITIRRVDSGVSEGIAELG